MRGIIRGTRSVGLVPLLAVFALLLWMPGEAAEGARQGLSLCAGVVVPSLLPFLILSALAAALGMPAVLARVCAPLFSLLGIPPVCAAPLLLGLTGGYPVGAAALAELVRSGALSPEEGARRLPFCNNTGPGLIVGFVGAGVFGSVRAGLALWLCHALAALALAALGGGRLSKAPTPQNAAPPEGLAAALPKSVQSAALSMLSICAYVVFCSVLTGLLRASGLFSSLAAALCSLFRGAEMRFFTALLSGLLELSTGIGAMRGMPPTPLNAALAAFLLGFGGLSVHCQTLCAVSSAKIKCARHFAGRIVHGFISALLAFALFTVFRLPQI